MPRRHLRRHRRRRQRDIAARAFYQGAYFTTLLPGEVITAIRIPMPPAGHGWAYEKLKRKVGDYATAAAGVVLTMQGGRVVRIAIGLTNVGDTPLFAEQAATILTGRRSTPRPSTAPSRQPRRSPPPPPTVAGRPPTAPKWPA